MTLEREGMGARPGRCAGWLATLLLGLPTIGCGTSNGTGPGAAHDAPLDRAAASDSGRIGTAALPSSVSTAPPSSAAGAVAGGDDAGAVTAYGALTLSREAADLELANLRWLPTCTLADASAIPAGRPPVVTLGQGTQAFPFEAVRRMVRKGAARTIEACVQEGRKRVPDLGGVVLLRFKLPNGGGIEQVEVVRGVGDPALHACVVDALAKTKLADLKLHGMVLSNVPVVACPDGRTLLWPEPPPPPP